MAADASSQSGRPRPWLLVARAITVLVALVSFVMPEKSAEAVKALKELAKEFRRELSKTMRLRRVPELRFKYDESVDRAERIETLLRENPVPPAEEPNE